MSKLAFEQQIGPAVRSTGNEIKRTLNTGLERYGVTGIRGALLGYLCRHGEQDEIFQRDVEQKFNIRRSSATALLQGLEEQGLLVRVPVQRDGRLKRLCVTEKGREMENIIRLFLDDMEARMRVDMTQEEVETLLRLLAKVRSNLAGDEEELASNE